MVKQMRTGGRTLVSLMTDLNGHLMFQRKLPKNLYHGVPVALPLTWHERKRKSAGDDVALAEPCGSAGHVSVWGMRCAKVVAERWQLTWVSQSTSRRSLSGNPHGYPYNAQSRARIRVTA